MRFIFIFLLSFNIMAESVVDEAVSVLRGLNSEVDESILNKCTRSIAVSSCTRTSELSQELSKFVKCDNSSNNKEDFYNFLKQDKTNERKYIASASSDDWYVCQHFSTQTFMRGSCFANSNHNETYQKHTPIDINNQESENANKFPIFYVHIQSAEKGFFHAINAYFTGDSVEDLGNLDNYIFFEPQNDKTLYNIDQLRFEWSRLKTARKLKIGIATMKKPGFTQSGGLQFISNSIVKFDCDLY